MVNEPEQGKIENIIALMAEARGAAARALNAVEDSAGSASYAADCIRKAQEQFTALTYRSPEVPRTASKGTWYMWVENGEDTEEIMQRLERIAKGAELMGNFAGISHDKFPKQSDHVGLRAGVTFHYDLKRVLYGTIVRDDVEAPFETIIALEDGRYVRGVECQYNPWYVPEAGAA